MTNNEILRQGLTETIWKPIKSAPRDGRNILIRFGQDGTSQAKYIAGLPHPWQFIDSNDGITWMINYAVDTPAGPTHWANFPPYLSDAILKRVAETTRNTMLKVIAAYRAKQAAAPLSEQLLKSGKP